MEPTIYTTNNEDQPTFWEKFKDNFAELIEFAAIMGAILFIIHVFIAEPHKVSGSSMEPNFMDGDYLITDKISSTFSDYQRGEVIILKYPLDPSKDFIKRIICLPGDRIKIQNGHVYINDQLLNEPYLQPNVQTYTRPGDFLQEGQDYTIPQGYYFVMGDNRQASSDSRTWGLLAKKFVIGYPWVRYWPPQKAEFIKVDKPSS